jgi:hypothetical protein
LFAFYISKIYFNRYHESKTEALSKRGFKTDNENVRKIKIMNLLTGNNCFNIQVEGKFLIRGQPQSQLGGSFLQGIYG